MIDNTDPIIVLSQTLKTVSKYFRAKGDEQKANFLLQMSKNVLAPGPIDKKIADIRRVLGDSLPDLGEAEYVKRYGDKPVEDFCAGIIRDCRNR